MIIFLIEIREDKDKQDKVLFLIFDFVYEQ